MLESAIGGIAVPLFEQLWKAGGHVVGQMSQANQKVKNVEEILKASRNYHQKYENSHGQIKIMPGLMKEPVPLASIYTAVKFLDERSIRQFDGPEELEQLYRDQGKRSFQTADKRHDGINVAKEKQYLMVLGSPGVGKSTFLRKLGLEALKGQKGQLKRDQIPVFIELKTFRDETIDLTAIIAHQFEIHGFPNTQAFTELSLVQGKLLILLDGLDEVPTDNVNQVIKCIEDFAIQHDKNTFVASCRTAAYRSSFKQFTDVTIADFDDEQIQQFIERWFNSKLDKRTDTANQYWKLLKQPENKAAKELAYTPLLLTFLCLIYEREQTLPTRRSTLYGRSLNILLSEWSAQKRLPKTSIYRNFHPELEKELLSEIAYNSFKEDRLFFSKSDIINRITTFLADTLDAPEYLDGLAVLQAIEVQQGILVERATDTYSFSHLTLQEYLTAMYIVNNQLISEVVSQHLTNQRWREVFLLVIGLMGRRGHKLLTMIDRQARKEVNDQPKIRSVVQWAGQITEGAASKHENFIKIAIAIAIYSAISSDIYSAIYHDIASVSARAINSSSTIYRTIFYQDHNTEINNKIGINIDIDIVSAVVNARAIASDTYSDISIYSNLVLAIEIAIDKSIHSANYLNTLRIFNTSKFEDLPNLLAVLKKKMPKPLASSYEWNHYANEIEAAFLHALNLTVAIISLSKEEWKCLDNYLYANALLINCQKASIGISRKAWYPLKEKLLTI